MTGRIVPFGLPRPYAEMVIRRLASANRFGMGEDANFELKMLERGFDMRQVLETLKKGVVNQGPALDDVGEWRCRVKRKVAGRTVRVVVAIAADFHFMTLLSVH